MTGPPSNAHSRPSTAAAASAERHGSESRARRRASTSCTPSGTPISSGVSPDVQRPPRSNTIRDQERLSVFIEDRHIDQVKPIEQVSVDPANDQLSLDDVTHGVQRESPHPFTAVIRTVEHHHSDDNEEEQCCDGQQG